MRKKSKWLGLLSIMPATAMIFIDQSVLPVALPTIQKELLATPNELWWAINSYLFISALFLLTSGKIGDRLGYRRVFLTGMLVFVTASLLSGLSQNMTWLITARGFQGLGSALMIPASAPLIMSLFPQNERGRANGINVSISSLFLITAPLLGGYLTQTFSWRWIFYINVPISILGFILVLRFIPISKKGDQKVDLKGFLSFILFCGSLVIFIMQEGQWGLSSLKSLGLITTCSIGAFLLYKREKTAKHPFIDLTLFKHPIYKAVNISIFATQFVLMITVYRAIFFQQGLDWSPLKSGTVLCFSSLPVVFLSPLGGWLADKFTPKLPLSLGFTFLISSFFCLSYFVQGSFWEIFFGLLIFSMGVPLIFTPSYASAMGTIPPKKAGLGFGVLATTRAISGTLGVAIISSFAYHTQVLSFKKLASENEITSMMNPSFLESLAKRGSAAEEILNTYQAQILPSLFKESEIQAFSLTHLIMGFLLMIAFAFVFVLYNRKTSQHSPKTPGEGWD